MPLLSTLGADTQRAYGVGGVIATSIGTQTAYTYTPGVSAGGGGPTGQPGTQYSTTGGNAVRLSYACISRTWSADSGGTNFSWNRSLAFIHPYSTISAATLDSWGLLNTDVVRATDIRFISASGAVDTNVTFYHAKLQNGSTNVGSYTNLTGIYTGDGPGSGRQGFSYSGSIALPNPDVNEMIFLLVYSASGYQTTTIGFSFTQWTV